MLTAIALVAALVGPTTVEMVPTDDVWVYPHASDTKDPYLRVWGAEGKDVAKNVNEMQDFGYAYLKFDVSKLPEGKITGATLTVTHIANPGFNADYSKQNPLRARPIPPDFNEKTWDYSKAEQIVPEAGDKAIFGSGYAASIPPDKEFTIALDLLKGPNDFRAFVGSARASTAKAMGLALTATMDVEEMGQACIYKFYSKDAEKESRRPVLKLTIDKP